MTPAPLITGYLFDRQVHAGNLAEIWLGTSAPGQQVAVTILTAAGAADPATRQRLEHSAQRNPLLWAANFSADRPYVIVRVASEQDTAGLLFDSLTALLPPAEQLDGAELRRLLLTPSTPAPAAPAVATPHTAAVPLGASDDTHPDTMTARAGPGATLKRNARAVAGIVTVVVICAAYLVGGTLNSALARSSSGQTDGQLPTPAPLPPDTLLPGVMKVPEAALRPGLRPVPVIGATYAADEKANPVIDLGLPFAFRWPSGSAGTIGLGETSYALFRRVIAGQNRAKTPIDLRLAAHPCQDLPTCLAERAVFDRTWTQKFTARPPATARDRQTWYTQSDSSSSKTYELTLTRAFTSCGQWWLVGAVITAMPEHRIDAQKVINDIRTQTS